MDSFRDVKKQLDIVEVIGNDLSLKRAGKQFKALCPFHEESTPSFTVRPAEQRYKCFGCDAEGDVIDYIQNRNAMKSPTDALQKVAYDNGIAVKGIDTESIKRRKKAYESNRSQMADFYKKRSEAESYLSSRGFTPEVTKRFGIGYNEKNHSITIPFLNTYGEAAGMAERFLEGDGPKYKNSADSEIFNKSQLLYGLDKARRDIEDKVYIVEGYFDVISMYQMGIGKAVAYCGQSMTEEQSNLLHHYITKRTKIYLIPDKDATGQNQIKKNIKILRTHNKNNIAIIDLPDDCKDVNDFLAAGYDFSSLKGETSEMFMLKKDLNDALDISDEYTIAHEYAKTTFNKMIRADMASFLSKRWNKPLEIVKSHMNSDDSTIDYGKKIYGASESWLSYQERARNGSKDKIFTNLRDVDKFIKGTNKKEVLTVLGRSGAGKTTFILNLIYNMIFNQKKNVLFSSLELAKESIIPQFIQIHNEWPAAKVERYAASGEYDKGIEEVLTALDEHWRVVDEDGQSWKDVEMFARTASESMFDEPVDVIFLDYFQYLRSTGKSKNDYADKSEMAREMKSLAKRLNVLLVVLTQASREGGGTGADKLTMSAARDTGAIEESSDYMLGVYRPAADPKLSEEERQEVQHEMYCQILKNRWGAIGEAPLHFDGMIKKISNWD